MTVVRYIVELIAWLQHTSEGFTESLYVIEVNTVHFMGCLHHTWLNGFTYMLKINPWKALMIIDML